MKCLVSPGVAGSQDAVLSLVAGFPSPAGNKIPSREQYIAVSASAVNEKNKEKRQREIKRK